MAPGSSAPGKVISAWILCNLPVSSDFRLMVCPENSVFLWVQEKSLIFVCSTFSCCKDRSDNSQAPYMSELKTEVWI